MCVTYTVMFVIFRMCVCWWLCVKCQQHNESRYAYSIYTSTHTHRLVAMQSHWRMQSGPTSLKTLPTGELMLRQLDPRYGNKQVVYNSWFNNMMKSVVSCDLHTRTSRIVNPKAILRMRPGHCMSSRLHSAAACGIEAAMRDVALAASANSSISRATSKKW